MSEDEVVCYFDQTSRGNMLLGLTGAATALSWGLVLTTKKAKTGLHSPVKRVRMTAAALCAVMAGGQVFLFAKGMSMRGQIAEDQKAVLSGGILTVHLKTKVHRIACADIASIGSANFFTIPSKYQGDPWATHAFRVKGDVVVAAPASNGYLVSLELKKEYAFDCKTQPGLIEADAATRAPLKAERNRDGDIITEVFRFGPLCQEGKQQFMD
eukprot:Hpha_TRINITY_DN30098_c0_g1::TRINITY_DN30098_c0_g1_i1::g.21554::m.21554